MEWHEMFPPFLRSLGFLTPLPFPHGYAGMSIRLAVSAVNAFVFSGIHDFPEHLSVVEAVLEFTAGFILSLPVQLILSICGMTGELADGVRGQTIGSMYDPSASAPVSVLGGFMRQYSWAVLLVQGSLEDMIQVLYRSYRTLPVAIWSVQGWIHEMPGRLFEISVVSLHMAMLCVLPFSLCCLLVEGGAALVCRVVPGLSLHGEAFQIKSLFALLTASVFLVATLPDAAGRALDSLQRFFLPL